MFRDYDYPSCGSGSIHARCWEPDGNPVGIVQLVHGVAEHLERYGEFAEYLNSQGYLVVAQDHMGHGKSGGGDQARGYFYGGWFAAVDDTYRLLKDTRSRYPELPYILFGHSMGSFIARTILGKYPESGISGCVICGTGWMPDAVLAMGRAAAKAVSGISSATAPSLLLQKMMFGSYNHHIEHPRTAFDWLTRDKRIVDGYMADPACGFTVTAGLAGDMMTGIQYIQKQKTLSQMASELPVLFIAGGDDPVGNYGAGVRQAVKAFKKAGMKMVRMKIYPLCRHEILNELNKEEIYQDIINWMDGL